MIRILTGVLLAAISVLAQAMPPRAETLIAEGLRAQAERQRQQDEAAVPVANRVDLYVGVDDRALQLRRVRWRIGVADVEQVFSFESAHAQLLGQPRRLARFAQLSLRAGVHELDVIVEAEQQRQGASPLAVEARLRRRLDKVDGAESWVLQLHAPTAAHAAQLVFQRHLPHLPMPGAWWRPDPQKDPAPSSGSPALAYVRYAGALADMQGDATAQLRMLFALRDSLDAETPEYRVALAEAYAHAGLAASAESLVERLSAENADAAALALLRWQLAEIWRARGDAAHAERLYLQARADMPPHRAMDWRLGYALLLIGGERVAEAVSLLEQDDPAEIDQQRWREDGESARRLAIYRRLNLAIALLRAGAPGAAMRWLDAIGRIDAGGDEELAALRDKANALLGWQLLGDRQGLRAAQVLGRVGSEGPSANLALLGIGWAQLAPAGMPPADDPQQARFDQALQHARQAGDAADLQVAPRAAPSRGDFSASAPRHAQAAIERALQAWQMLATRDSRDPAVVEGLLAMGYAHEQAGAARSAQARYTQAVTLLEARRAQIRKNRARSAALAAELAAAPDESQLQALLLREYLPPQTLGSPPFQTMSELWRLAALIEQGRADGQVSRTRELERLLAERRSVAAAQFRTLFGQGLKSREAEIDRYLQAALFSLARLQDPGSAKPRPVPARRGSKAGRAPDSR